jgi:1,3-beta-glucanosyltransferase GAS5
LKPLLTPLYSLSEYGCITNTRDFGEVAALYGSQMTPVYSGGLVYEYSEEGSGYGLVNINSGSISEKPDFSALQSAYKATAQPTGDGGYKSSGAASTCPSQSSIWLVQDPHSLPNMPSGAQKYFSSGAGAGPGNKGSTGSQTAGGASSGWSVDTSTSSSGSASSTTKKAGAANVHIPELSMAPFVVAVVVGLSSLVGGVGFLL